MSSPTTPAAQPSSPPSPHSDDDADLQAMKTRVAEMEAEAAKLRAMQAQVDGGDEAAVSGVLAQVAAQEVQEEEDKESVDRRSVYVGNVDYGASPEELQQHFLACGTINRVTILCDKFTNHPKGFAYVEFAEELFAQNALVMNESLFRSRLIQVTMKRTNVPGLSARGRGRGRGGFRGYPTRGYRGRGRGAWRGY